VDVRVEPITFLTVGLQTVLGRDPLDLVRNGLEAADELAMSQAERTSSRTLRKS
jgi:hypothetical protein